MKKVYLLGTVMALAIVSGTGVAYACKDESPIKTVSHHRHEDKPVDTPTPPPESTPVPEATPEATPVVAPVETPTPAPVEDTPVVADTPYIQMK